MLALTLTVAGIAMLGWEFSSNSLQDIKQNPTEQVPAEPLALAREIITPPPLRGPQEERAGTLTTGGVFTETNKHRIANQVKPLLRHTTLDAAAQNKLNDMFAKQYFDHVAPDGKGPAEVVDGAGYQYIRVGENLALGNFASDIELVAAWMDSPGHRANIISPGFTEIGIAVGQGQFEGRQTWLAVQTFGIPLSACAGPNQALIQEVEDQKFTLETLQQELQNKDSAINEQIIIMQNTASEIESLVRSGNQKITEGNRQTEAGNRVYQETGSQEQAQPDWERGQRLQRQGQELLDQAQAKQAALNSTQTDLARLQMDYNSIVEKYNSLNQALKTDIGQYNRQIKAFNACVEDFSNR